MLLQSLVKSLFYRLGYSIKKIRALPASAKPAAAAWGESAGPDLLALLHAVNPYEGFPFQDYPNDSRGWGAESPVFRELIERVRPKLIVEVGTWKGASALSMARLLAEFQIPGQIVCVDTWLGALEFWTDQQDAERYGALKLKHGYPSVYYQFLANVCHQGEQARIVPFPQTASAAALWFRYFGIFADLIYVDASHEEEDVLTDLGNYWPIVSPTGVLFGDDYTWDGVRLAVTRFAKENGLRVEVRNEKWIMHR